MTRPMLPRLNLYHESQSTAAERKLALLRIGRFDASAVALSAQNGRRDTPNRRQQARDLQDLCEAGLLREEGRGPRRQVKHTAPKYRYSMAPARRRWLVRTEKGDALLASLAPPPPRVAQPYAKRRAAIAELKAARRPARTRLAELAP